MSDIGDAIAWAFGFFVVALLVAGVVIGSCSALVATHYTAHVSIEKRP